ncbi:MAG: exodeoxyribonuclease III [Flavobacteriales bacterium]|nr:exodeoxyribonuclease III [Flavobacteriales bacterium]
MKLISWNVNGIRAVAKKGLDQIIHELDADIICFQETKATVEQVKETLAFASKYEVYANEAERKGYSGTAVMSRVPVISVSYDMGIEEHDQEGRVICVELEKCFVVTVYTPNSGSELARLDYRSQWDKDFAQYIKKLKAKKPVLACGDFNVAHRDIDLARPKPNYNKSAGYTQTEIDGLDGILAVDMIDSFRSLHPEKVKYSWWSYRAGARGKNIGWRIDYWLVDQALKDAIAHSDILNEVMGSDHCPVEVQMSF